jgi:hypothetical protein
MTLLPGAQEARLDLSWSTTGRFLAYIDAASAAVRGHSAPRNHIYPMEAA